MNWLHLIYSFLVMSWTPLRERKGAHELRTRTKQSSGCLARTGVWGPLREGLLAIRVWILCAPNPLACIHSHSSSQGPKSIFALSFWLYLSKVKWSPTYSMFKMEPIFSSFLFIFLPKLLPFLLFQFFLNVSPASPTQLPVLEIVFLCSLPGCPDLFPALSVFTQTLSAVFLWVFLLHLLSPIPFLLHPTAKANFVNTHLIAAVL